MCIYIYIYIYIYTNIYIYIYYIYVFNNFGKQSHIITITASKKIYIE